MVNSFSKKITGKIIDKTLLSGSKLLLATAKETPKKLNIEVCKDLAYIQDGSNDHKLDIYQPLGRKHNAPILLYIHGGGFKILSKDSHWMMAMQYAKMGFLVFNINYRLAPEHAFPYGLLDCVDALLWVLDNAKKYGGDTNNIVVAGESAGANYTLNLALLKSKKDLHNKAANKTSVKKLYQRNPQIKTIIPACGFLHVNDIQRFDKKISKIIYSRIETIHDAYLKTANLKLANNKLIDPLTIIEEGAKFNRKFPDVLTFSGGGDPVVSDTLRLHAALTKRGLNSKCHIYGNLPHAFHAIPWYKETKTCWQHQYDFLSELKYFKLNENYKP